MSFVADFPQFGCQGGSPGARDRHFRNEAFDVSRELLVCRIITRIQQFGPIQVGLLDCTLPLPDLGFPSVSRAWSYCFRFLRRQVSVSKSCSWHLSTFLDFMNFDPV